MNTVEIIRTIMAVSGISISGILFALDMLQNKNKKGVIPFLLDMVLFGISSYLGSGLIGVIFGFVTTKVKMTMAFSDIAEEQEKPQTIAKWIVAIIVLSLVLDFSSVIMDIVSLRTKL